MKNSTAQIVKRIFGEALDKSTDERAAFVINACCGDAELQKKVEALLVACEGAGEFMSAPTNAGVGFRAKVDAEAGGPETHDSKRRGEEPGATIGRYKLLQQIGEGGFGVVYMAEQTEPVRRKVALKIIKLGMDTKQVIARFEAERQALAMMHHPNIASVLDGGATETGRPYFVMELVKGIPITEYCDQNSLSTKERLDLFRSVCNAVQHAHQKGIIHRDIKPTNVMVTLHDGKPVPKVIDFGIAKATDHNLTEKTLFTDYHQLIGTPAYMSPEQAEMSGLDVDTRTDIYSLGVLLYELLTGTTPFDAKMFRQAAYGEIQRIIREVEPPNPSTRVSSLATEPRAQATGARPSESGSSSLADIARHRRSDPSALSKLIRGDLDWIVMKALEKDRTRRYETAKEFAKDVEHHLANEPILASPPGAAYKFRKFIKRNRVAVTAGLFVAAALVFGFTLSTIGFVQASRERERAREAEVDAKQLAGDARTAAERERKLRQAAEEQRKLAKQNAARAAAEAAWAEDVTDFLEKTLSSVDPFTATGREVTVATMLDEATRRINNGELSGKPFVEAKVRKTLGRLYLHLHLGRLETAELHFRKALEIWKDHCPKGTPPGEVNRLLDLAEVMEEKDDAPAAEQLYRDALASARNRRYDREINRKALSALAWFLMERRIDLGEVESRYREALAIAIEIHGTDHAAVAESMNLLARALTARGALDEAEALLKDALSMQRAILGDQHPDVAATVFNVGELLLARGDRDGAESHYRDALAMRRELLGVHKDIAVNIIMLAHLLKDKDELDEAEALFREVVSGARKWLPEGHPGLANCLNDLSLVLHQSGKHEEAEEALLEAIRIRREALGDEHSETVQSIGNLAGLYFHLERYEEAEPLLVEVGEWIERHPDAPESIRQQMLTMLVKVYETPGRPQQAAEWRAKLSPEAVPSADDGDRP